MTLFAHASSLWTASNVSWSGYTTLDPFVSLHMTRHKGLGMHSKACCCCCLTPAILCALAGVEY